MPRPAESWPRLGGMGPVTRMDGYRLLMKDRQGHKEGVLPSSQ